MIDVQSFLVAAGHANGDATLALDFDRQGVTARSGRVARWLAHIRKVENRALAERFVDALVERYGEDPAAAAAATTGLARTRARGTALRVREVREVIQRAQGFQESFSIANRRWADRTRAAGVTPTDLANSVPLLRVKIDAAARVRFRENPSVSKLVDPEVVARKTQEAIMANGRGGKHLVSIQEAANVLTRVVADELETAYVSHRNRAFRALSLTEGSIARQAYERAAAELELPPDVCLEQLTPDAAEDLEGRLHEGVLTGRIPADRLDDDAALTEFAHTEAQRFLAERVEARAAVAGLDLGGEASRSARAALLSLVTRDNVPAHFVSAMGRAYARAREDIARLAGSSSDAALAVSIRNIQLEIEKAFLETDIRIEVDNQNRMFDQAWRFLLAPGGEAQAAAILGRFAPADSLLRGITEGASNYRLLFPGTTEWSRTYRGVHKSLNGQRIHNQQSRQTASVYSTLMLSLCRILDQSVVGGMNVEEPDIERTPGDGAVAALRNFGIPFPPPDRVGEANPHVSLSDTQAAVIVAELRSRPTHGIREASDESGLAKACLEGLEADHERYQQQVDRFGSGRVINRFYIDSEQCLPQNPAAVVRALRDFCMEQDGEGAGTLNRELLQKVSAMATQDTIECVHRGCMNPNRPDLAIMNGDLQGVVDSTEYRLSRGDNGEIRLRVEQLFRPLWYLPANKDADVEALGPEEDAVPDRIALSPTQSHFRTTVELRLVPNTREPVIDNVDLGYRLVEGVHNENESPYIIHNPARV
ncbi:MAG: hypothetical protein OXE40_10400 [Gammaproteobacteria bacterium]|nr:hypothetical protein [Gammaproteobacteria bacterium]